MRTTATRRGEQENEETKRDIVGGSSGKEMRVAHHRHAERPRRGAEAGLRGGGSRWQRPACAPISGATVEPGGRLIPTTAIAMPCTPDELDPLAVTNARGEFLSAGVRL